MHKSIPIWRDATALLLEVEQVVRHFPRYHKYTLGTEMRQQVMLICRLINRAFNKAQEKRSVVEQLVMAGKFVILWLIVVVISNHLRNFAEFERLSVLAVQIGKQSGGWFRHV